jgi:DedD protein
MNPELKHRLIGAAVVTALATIFIPMLFDDPVDNRGQSVSEIPIPATPVKSTEVSANKVTTPANKPSKKPGTTPDESGNPEEEPTDAVSEAEMTDDSEAEATAEPPVNESTPTQAEAVANAEQAGTEEVPLDTGIIPEAKSPGKKPPVKPKPLETDAAMPKVNPVAKNSSARLVPAIKPTETVAAVKPAVKKPEITKPLPTVKPPVNPVSPAATPAKAPELVRWTIYAGSFGQKDNATTLMKSLREQGIPVVIETRGSIYRLKIGPELDKKKAAATKAKLDKQRVENVMISE